MVDALFEILTIDQLEDWCKDVPVEQRVHVKGFGGGMQMHLCENEVMKRLTRFTLLVWDGDSFHEDGFTAVVPKFLEAGPTFRVLAFKIQRDMSKFQHTWKEVAARFPKRIAVVTIDPDKDCERFPQISVEMAQVGVSVQKYWRLGRLALLSTGSKQVISMGGGGTVAYEAESTKCVSQDNSQSDKDIGKGVYWAVFAMSRGQKEKHDSAMDWAARNRGSYVELITGRDPKETDAFCTEVLDGVLDNIEKPQLSAEETHARDTILKAFTAACSEKGRNLRRAELQELIRKLDLQCLQDRGEKAVDFFFKDKNENEVISVEELMGWMYGPPGALSEPERAKVHRTCESSAST